MDVRIKYVSDRHFQSHGKCRKEPRYGVEWILRFPKRGPQRRERFTGSHHPRAGEAPQSHRM